MQKLKDLLPESLKFDWSTLGIKPGMVAVVTKRFSTKDLDTKSHETNAIKRFFNFEKLMTPKYTFQEGTTLALFTGVQGAKIAGWTFDAWAIGTEHDESIGTKFKFYYGEEYNSFQEQDTAWLLMKSIYLGLKQEFITLEPKNKFADYTIAYIRFEQDKGRKMGIRSLTRLSPRFTEGEVEIKGFNAKGLPLHKLIRIEDIAKAYPN